MGNKFVEAMVKEGNRTLTENGMEAVKSTESALVDLFGVIGALRSRSSDEVERLFAAAMSEDKLLAVKLAFYSRDIRGGLGERRVSKDIFKYLANVHPDIMKKNLCYVPAFGRWDDLYVFVGTPVEDAMWELVKEQFERDLDGMSKGENVSLLGKWLKSVNTSSAESRELGRLTAKKLGLKEREYRKTLSALRKYIDVVEVKMSEGRWEDIDYSQVPSLAMKNYRNAFRNRDGARFEEFINKVATGEEKINASTLYPYNIIEGYGLNTWGRSHISTYKNFDMVLEEQWKALPNYVTGENNILIMADTSGSMEGRPLNTSVGLAIYFAERNKGEFKDLFLTFSSKPSLVKLKGDTLYDKIKSVPAIVDNTDIEAAFDLVLNTSIERNVPKEDMPKAIVIISDMEFDNIHANNKWDSDNVDWTFYGEMKERFEKSGYDMPNIVFWNVDSRNDVFHAFSDYRGVQMASGQSVAIFKQILNNLDKTPYEAMLEVLNRPEYDCITI